MTANKIEHIGSEAMILPSLQTKTKFDTLAAIESRKPELSDSGSDKKRDSAESSKISNDTPILADTPNSHKRRGVSLTKNFIQLVRSEKTLSLLANDHKAFVLLTIISLRASRDEDMITGLLPGECFISTKTTPEECGLTTKEYRNAKIRLIQFGFIKEIYNPEWEKKSKSENSRIAAELSNFKKRATKRATKCCIVSICNEDIYDINLVGKGNQKGNQRATKGQPKGNIQEGKEGKEVKNTNPLPPKGELLLDVPFSSKKEDEEKVHVHRDVFLTSQELQDCIRVRGSLDAVKEAIDNILDWPDRKHKITKWAENIKKWKVKNIVVDKRSGNEQYGKTLEIKYGRVNSGWRPRDYRDRNKDDHGLLFETIGGAHSYTEFFSYSDQNFTQKVENFIRQKNIK